MHWKTAWSYLSIDYGTPIGTLEDITQVTTLRNNISGNCVRLRFTNQYADGPLVLEHVLLGCRERGSEQVKEIGCLLHKGERKIVIPPGASFYSDPLSCHVGCTEDLVVSAYIKEQVKVRAACLTWAARSWQSYYCPHEHTGFPAPENGMTSAAVYPVLSLDVHEPTAAVGFCGVQVFTDDPVETIALFGDSITHMSYYSDALIDRLYTQRPGGVTVLNRGIGGNRLLMNASYFPGAPGNGHLFGRAGVRRFNRDVLRGDHPDRILVLMGVNDLMHPYFLNHPNEVVDAAQLIQGFKQLVNAAHDNHAEIWLGTIMPFRHASIEWDIREAERSRILCNQWIREQKTADGVLDFDVQVRDDACPGMMREATHLGDGLHPNAIGGEAMLGALPGDMFRGVP